MIFRVTSILVIAVCLLGVSDAQFTSEITITDSQITITGGVYSVPATYSKIKWTNVTMVGAVVNIGVGANSGAVSFEVVDSTFVNVAFKVQTQPPLGNVLFDIPRVFKFMGNSMVYTSEHIFHLTETAHFEVNLENYATYNTNPADFVFADNDIANTCGPASYIHVVDRFAGPPYIDPALLAACNDIGVLVDCSAATKDLIFSYLVQEGIDTCTTTFSTAVYGLQQKNNGLYGTLVDVSGCNTYECNGFCSDDCSDPVENVEVQVGRFVRFTKQEYNALTQLFTIEVEAEIYQDEAVTIHTDPAFVNLDTVVSAGTCLSRTALTPTLVEYQTMHTTGQLDDGGARWDRVLPDRSISLATHSVNVAVYEIVLDYAGLVECSTLSGTPGVIVMTTRVIHSDHLVSLSQTHVTAINTLETRISFFQEFVAVYSNLNVINSRPLLVHPQPTEVLPSSVMFNAEVCIPNNGAPIALRYPTQSTTTSVVHGNVINPACTMNSGLDPTLCSSTTSWTITPGCLTTGTTHSTLTHCCQYITVETDLPYFDIDTLGQVTLEAYDGNGDGISVEPDRLLTLTFVHHRTDGLLALDGSNLLLSVQPYTDITVIVPNFSGDDSGSINSNYLVGQTMVFKIFIDNLDYTVNGFGTFQLDLTQIKFCSAYSSTGDPSCVVPALIPAQHELTGCQAYLPGCEQTVQTVVDVFSPACDVAQTSTSHRGVCYADSTVRFYDNQHVLGRCDTDRSLCITPEGAGLPSDTLGAVTCPGVGEQCHQSDGDDHSRNEIVSMSQEWGEKFCMPPLPATVPVSCEATTSVCANPSECYRILDHIVVTVVAPLHAYGEAQNGEPIVTNFFGTVSLTTHTPTSTTRRLLELGGADTDAGQNYLRTKKHIKANSIPTQGRIDALRSSLRDSLSAFHDGHIPTTQENLPILREATKLLRDTKHVTAQSTNVDTARINELEPTLAQVHALLRSKGAMNTKEGLDLLTSQRHLLQAEGEVRQVRTGLSATINPLCTPGTVTCPYGGNNISQTCETPENCAILKAKFLGDSLETRTAGLNTRGSQQNGFLLRAAVTSTASDASASSAKGMLSILGTVSSTTFAVAIVAVGVFAVSRLKKKRDQESNLLPQK